MPNVHNVRELAEAQARGVLHTFVFFPDSGTYSEPPTSSCLSQWAITPFDWNGLRFHSAEQAMMHGKALLFGDQEMADRILRSKSPYQAKNLGAQVRGFEEDRWVAHRFDVVLQANMGKFKTRNDMKELLLSTGDAILVEESPFDRIWGNGLDASDRHSCNAGKWPGLNLLGFALMEVRSRLESTAE